MAFLGAAAAWAILSFNPLIQTRPHQRNNRPENHDATQARKKSAGQVTSFTKPVTTPIPNPTNPPMIIIFFMLI